MAILFRPAYPVDHVYPPVLRQVFADRDLRFYPDYGNEKDIEYLISWRLESGDRTRWPNLKAFLSLSAGVNQYVGNPDFPEGAKLIRMLDPGLKQSMTEYVAGLVLRFHRGYDDFRDMDRAAPWGTMIPKRAPETTIGFLGLGDLSTACIDALRPFGFKMRGWSRSLKKFPDVADFAGREELGSFLGETDILVCLLPLTPETENILNRDTLCRLPKGSCLINAARGKHVVDEDLLSLLDENHLRYAALDVFRKEPLPVDHPYWTHPRVIVTPHVAAVTCPDTATPVLLQTIETLESGENPPGLVDLDRGY